MNIRIPPYSEEAEQATIGCVLHGGIKCYDAIMDAHKLTAEDFHFPAYRTVWTHIAEMAQNDKPIDALTVSHKAKEREELDLIGGYIALERCLDAAVTPSHYDYYASIVKTKAKLRRIIQAARAAENEAYADEADPVLVASKAEMEIHSAVDGKAGGAKRTNADAYDANRTLWETSFEKGGVGLQTGVWIIDHGFGGILPGLLFAISGPPGSGKTTLARNVAENVAETLVGTDGHVAIKSIEQSHDQLVGSITDRYAGVRVSDLNAGCHGNRELLTKYLQRIDQAREKVLSLPIVIDDTPATIPELWSWWRKAVSNGAKLGIIDYMQLISPTPAQASMKQAELVADVNRNLVRMVKETRDASLIVISAETDGQLRWSKEIEYGLGGWLRIWKNLDEENRYDTQMRKSRFSKCSTSSVTMRWWNNQLITDEEYKAKLAHKEMMR